MSERVDRAYSCHLAIVIGVIRGKCRDKNVILIIPQDTSNVNRTAFINLKYGKLAQEIPRPLAGSAMPVRLYVKEIKDIERGYEMIRIKIFATFTQS